MAAAHNNSDTAARRLVGPGLTSASPVHTPSAEPSSHTVKPVIVDSEAATQHRRAPLRARYWGVYAVRPPRAGPTGVPSIFVNLGLVMPCEPGTRDGFPATLTTVP